MEYHPETGRVERECWYELASPNYNSLQYSTRQRGADGLSERRYDPYNGNIVEEIWRKNSWIHRDNAPAVIKYDPKTGNKIYEAWHQGEVKHRENGPAVTEFDANTGAVTSQRWYKKGKEIADPNAPFMQRARFRLGL